MKAFWHIVIILFILTFTGGSVIFYGLLRTYSFDKAMIYMFNVDNNELIVEVKKPLVKEKVKIKLYVEDEDSTVYADGERDESIDNEYGEYEFTVTYDNKYYITLRHFRENWHDQYRYSFKLEKRGEDILLEVNFYFNGINEMNSTQIMEKMKDLE